MDLAERRIYIIKNLPTSKENFVKTSVIGGCDRSYHSNDLFALYKLGLVDRKRFCIKKNTIGHWRYKLTPKGDILKEQIFQSKSIKDYKKEVLSNKNGIRARNF